MALSLAGVMLMAAALACGGASPGTLPPRAATVTAGGAGVGVADLARATVQVLALRQAPGGLQPVWSGSGSVISPDGLILSNAHVVDDRAGDYDRLGIAITDRTDQAPRLAYLAEIASVDYGLDLAVLRIASDLSGEKVAVNLPSVALGDSDQVEIGDNLRILGYPGIGGETITFTEGAVSGFTSERGVEGRAWIKTDATIAGGNSGGMAVNAAGQLIGIPTRASASGENQDIVDCRPVVDTNRDGVVDENDNCVPIGGFINGLRPINLARPLVEAAERGEAYVVGPPEAPAAGGGYDINAAEFSRLIFADGVTDDDQPTQQWVAFPSGAGQVCAFWDYHGMADGLTWSAYWFVNGELSQGGSILGDAWEGGGQGNWWACVYDDSGLEEGLYELVLEVGDRVLVTDSVFVGGNHELIRFRLQNNADRSAHFVYLSPSQAQNWGQDELGGQALLDPGQSVDIELPSGTYDLLVTDEHGEALAEDYSLNLSADSSYQLGP
jgi:serine protease Do